MRVIDSIACTATTTARPSLAASLLLMLVVVQSVRTPPPTRECVRVLIGPPPLHVCHCCIVEGVDGWWAVQLRPENGDKYRFINKYARPAW